MLFSVSTFVWDLALLLSIAACAAVAYTCLAQRQAQKTSYRFTRTMLAGLGIVMILIVLMITYGSLIEPKFLFVTAKSIRLPVSHQLKIVVISDLHIGAYKDAGYLKRVVQRTNDLLPDIVLIPGDFVMNGDAGQSTLQALAPLNDLNPVFGTFAVLGNHDYGLTHSPMGKLLRRNNASEDVAAELKRLNITVLRNQHVVLSLGTESIAIAGIEDLLSAKADLGTALGTAGDLPVILLSHSPDVILNPLSQRASLIVSGHTHGGQIRLPWFGPLISPPTRLGKPYAQGLFFTGPNSTLAVTRGVGESGPRTRLFAPPEILLLVSRGDSPENADDDFMESSVTFGR